MLLAKGTSIREQYGKKGVRAALAGLLSQSPRLGLASKLEVQGCSAIIS
jgi:hypothetical protein